MGGSGSGWHSLGRKRTAGSLPQIDIRLMKAYLAPGTEGTLSWSRGSETNEGIVFRMKENHMVLSYLVRINGGEWEPIEQTIRFSRTSCNYGGYRTWFVCSRCRRRVAILYCADKDFVCRHCSHLAYGSQQEGMTDRFMRKARKIRKKLGANENLLLPIWRKPKYMHWKTFERLRREANHASNRSLLMSARKIGLKV